MTEKKTTLGQAIDQIIDALNALDPDARQTAIDAACSHLGIKTNRGQAPSTSQFSASTLTPSIRTTPPAPGGETRKRVDIRSLKDQKQPASAKQMACLVAYYLQELAPDTEQKQTVSSQDIEKYFKQAGFKLPKALEQILPDAKSSGYFESAGRGEYKLNAVGYNLIAHSLPKNKGE
jgi:hypothetical protein